MFGNVSVLMPVLNGASYLQEALSSLEIQTYRDIELLVWDNGSTDGTLEILQHWIPGKLPGHVFKGEPLSLGQSLARLVEASQNELCARMDADDICHPDRLMRQLMYLKGKPNLSLIGTDRVCIDLNGNTIDVSSSLPYDPTDILHCTLIGPRILHPTVLFKRSAVLGVGNYQDHSTCEQPYWSEDYDLWMRLQTFGLAATIPDQLLFYRINPDGVTQKAMREKRAAVARRRVWERNAAAFTGIPAINAMKIHDRSCSFLLPLALQVSKHFSILDGIQTTRRFIKPSFLLAIGKYTNPRDIITRLWLRIMLALSNSEILSAKLNVLPKSVRDHLE